MEIKNQPVSLEKSSEFINQILKNHKGMYIVSCCGGIFGRGKHSLSKYSRKLPNFLFEAICNYLCSFWGSSEPKRSERE